MHNCEIIVSTGIWPPSVMDVNSNEPGIEIDFILTVMQHLNASIKFVVDADSWHGLTEDEREEHTGRLALLKKETFDFMAGSIPAHYNIFRDFDTSECYLPNSIAFIVPTAAVFPSSLILWSMLEVIYKVYGIFIKFAWFRLSVSSLLHQKNSILLLLIVVFVIFLSIFINLLIQTTWKMRLNSKPKKSFFNNILTTFLTFLRSLIETSTPILPENRTVRWIYGMWFGACLIISCYFNTTLTSFFTEPGRLKQLETVQDVINSRIQIAMVEL